MLGAPKENGDPGGPPFLVCLEERVTRLARNLLGVSLATLGSVSRELAGAEGLAAVLPVTGNLAAGWRLLGAGAKARKLPITPFSRNSVSNLRKSHVSDIPTTRPVARSASQY
jgi:hypothetical protein